MKHVYLTFLALCLVLATQAQTYSYVLEEWNFTKGSLLSEEGTNATFLGSNSVVGDDALDDQYFVDRANGFSGDVVIPNITSGKVHVYVTISDWNLSTNDSGDEAFSVRLRSDNFNGGTNTNINIAELKFLAHGNTGLMRIAGQGTAGNLNDGHISTTGVTIGMTVDFDGGTTNSGSYTYWLGSPDDDGSGWSRFAAHTGDLDLSQGPIDGFQWGLANTSAGYYLNLDRVVIIHETNVAPATVAFESASKDDAVVVSADYATMNDARMYSLTVDNGATLTINNNDDVTVLGDLIVNGSIVVNSTGALKTFGSITMGPNGSFTKKRSTTYGSTDGRYSIVGSPVADATTAVLGGITYKYDEITAYGSGNQERFTLVSTPEVMAPADGYFSADLGTASFVGTPNTGNYVVPLIYDETNDGGPTNAGWNLVSNPYPSSIELLSFLSSNPDILGAVYIWDDGDSKAGQRTNDDYITVNAAGATGGSGNAANWDGYIRSEQGFFVKATSAGTLNFTDMMKASGVNTGAGYFREDAQADRLRITLSNNSSTSELLLAMMDRATNGFDRAFDAPKIKANANMNIYSLLNDDQQLAIQSLPKQGYIDQIWLGMDIAAAGDYTFSFENAFGLVNAQLVDHLTNKIVNLNEASSYTFHSDVTSGSKRFSINLTSAILALDDQIALAEMIGFFNADMLTIRSKESFVNASISVHDIQGRLLLNANGINSVNGEWKTNFASKNGVYIIKIADQGQTHSFKILK